MTLFSVPCHERRYNYVTRKNSRKIMTLCICRLELPQKTAADGRHLFATQT